MAWTHRNGHKYFYKSQRDGKQVHKIYVGKGDLGRAAEIALAIRANQRQEVRCWLRQSAAKFAEVDVIDALLAVDLAAVLYARTGIRMDARIGRRILRVQRSVMEDKIDEQIVLEADDSTWRELAERASRGDREAAAALIPLLDTNPGLVARFGDLSRTALQCWLAIVGSDDLRREAVHRDVLKLVKSVRQFDDDPLEETMAKRVGLIWLQAGYFDSQVALAANRTPAEQKFLAERQKAAQQLYASATKALREYQAQQVRLQKNPMGNQNEISRAS